MTLLEILYMHKKLDIKTINVPTCFIIYLLCKYLCVSVRISVCVCMCIVCVYEMSFVKGV